ncbi:uncharacterized protein LOC107495576 [Arachis duranensis]|uniref:Uncharacterized protein LOC107495576 n=1 Tax=Arachis duranensis TaxID=130453 RepID=A0A6P4DTY4_ARADU|nr:uncharacterized protein LOC107495576 [Arachis duranensis]
MEWCDHCVRYQQTRIEQIPDVFPKNFNGSCSTCGKVLWDMSIGFSQQIKNNSKGYDRMKKVRKVKDNPKVEKCVVVDSMDEEDYSTDEEDNDDKEEDKSINSDIN